MKKKPVFEFTINGPEYLMRLKHHLEGISPKVKVFTGSLEDRYEIYLDNCQDETPLSFDDWLNR